MALLKALGKIVGSLVFAMLFLGVMVTRTELGNPSNEKQSKELRSGLIVRTSFSEIAPTQALPVVSTEVKTYDRLIVLGDNLSKISKQTCNTVPELAELNNIKIKLSDYRLTNIKYNKRKAIVIQIQFSKKNCYGR